MHGRCTRREVTTTGDTGYVEGSALVLRDRPEAAPPPLSETFVSSRTARLIAVVCVAATAATLTLTTPAAARGGNLPPTELLGEHGPPVPLKNQAQISVSKWGIRYEAGQQSSHLTITEVGSKVRYVDTGTQRWRKLPRNCVRQSVPRGVAALCSIPPRFAGKQVFLEVWPRLGNDNINASAISARYRVWVLADAGRDTVVTGAGADFVNGAQNRDRVQGGAGNDWLRTGKSNDTVSGGDGADKIVGADGNDRMTGGLGADRLYGAGGRDVAYRDGADRIVLAEVIRRS